VVATLSLCKLLSITPIRVYWCLDWTSRGLPVLFCTQRLELIRQAARRVDIAEAGLILDWEEYHCPIELGEEGEREDGGVDATVAKPED